MEKEQKAREYKLISHLYQIADSWTTNTMSEKMRLLESELAELVKELKI